MPQFDSWVVYHAWTQSVPSAVADGCAADTIDSPLGYAPIRYRGRY